MLRGFLATGADRFLEAAAGAAEAGWQARWRSSTVQCHGLAGDAELLLDLYEATGEARWKVLAADAAEVILLQRRRDGDHLVFPDDTGAGLSAGLNTGLAGVASFFLRLTAGGTRPFMLDRVAPVRR
jgi:hypothetical protein